MGYGGQEARADGGKIFLGGVLGSSMRAAKPDITFEAAGWRGGAFRKFFTDKPTRDGGFGITSTLSRNTRFRARVGDAVSNVITAYAWPHIRYGKPHYQGRTHISIGMTVRSPGVSVRGHTLVMYIERAKKKRMTRLGSARLRAAGRGGRTRATIHFKALRKVGRKDYLLVCIQNGLSLGLGRPTQLTRHCGARSIRG